MRKICSVCKILYHSHHERCFAHGATLEPFLLDLKYEILEELGEGGFGRVFKVRNVNTNKVWAVKIMVLDSEWQIEERTERFLREARLCSRMAHENVIQMIDFGVCRRSGLCFLVMEFIEGISLVDFQNRFPNGMERQAVATLFKQLCRGVAAIHAEGIIHRDLNPKNVMLVGGNPERLKIIDFGLAKNIANPEYSLTGGDFVLGTEDYMAPEQFDQRKTEDFRTDIYSLGIILLELLKGKDMPVRQIKDRMEYYYQRVLFSVEFPDLRKIIPRTVSDEIVEIVSKAMRNNPDQRFQTVDELLTAFSEKSFWETRVVATTPGVAQVIATPPSVAPIAPAPPPPMSEAPQPPVHPPTLRAVLVPSTPPEVRSPPPFPVPPPLPPSLPPPNPFEVTLKMGSEPVRPPAPRKSSRRLIRKPAPAVRRYIDPKIEMIKIPGGSFLMGSGDDSVFQALEMTRSSDQNVTWDWFADEAVEREVTINYSFYIGMYPVTQRQWKAVMGKNPSYFQGENSRFDCNDLPVENVTWEDVQAFLGYLNAMSNGLTYRLPTEAEWEYACRAGNNGLFAGRLMDMAWYAGNSGVTRIMADRLWRDDRENYEARLLANGCQTHPVGTKAPNTFGLYDMHGNVWEWCADWYDENFYREAPTVNPVRTGNGKSRVLRGGSWRDLARYCRSAYRYWSPPEFRSDGYGFRVVADLR